MRASEATFSSEYHSPNIALCAILGFLTGIVGIWMPAIGSLAGFNGLDVLANPIWGFAYNVASGCINWLLGSAPVTLGGVLILSIGITTWPLLVCISVGYGLFRYSSWRGGRLKIAAGILFFLSLLVNLPASWFTSNGASCAFFLFTGLIY
ncbi:MAG TPA: hypothetical protein VGC10_06645 [Sphingomonas sp.]